MSVSRIIHIMFMNIHCKSHMFRNILQSSFESSRKFNNILYYSSNFYVLPASFRKFYVFLVNSKISRYFWDASKSFHWFFHPMPYFIPMIPLILEPSRYKIFLPIKIKNNFIILHIKQIVKFIIHLNWKVFIKTAVKFRHV